MRPTGAFVKAVSPAMGLWCESFFLRWVLALGLGLEALAPSAESVFSPHGLEDHGSILSDGPRNGAMP